MTTTDLRTSLSSITVSSLPINLFLYICTFIFAFFWCAEISDLAVLPHFVVAGLKDWSFEASVFFYVSLYVNSK